MSESVEATKTKILESARSEFLKNGFTNASLRTIASNAGLTTGAMYRHFKDKDALFCALVDEAIETAKKAICMGNVEMHANSSVNVLGRKHFEEEDKMMEDFLDYIYANFDAYVLLLTKAAGSTHENFIKEMTDLYTENCTQILNWMKKKFHVRKQIDPMSIHVLSYMIVTTYCEIILHKMDKSTAKKLINDMSEFFRFGFMHLLGLK